MKASETYPRYVLLYKKLTVQSAALINTKHTFQSYFRHTEELPASIPGQLFLYSAENINKQSRMHRFIYKLPCAKLRQGQKQRTVNVLKALILDISMASGADPGH